MKKELNYIDGVSNLIQTAAFKLREYGVEMDDIIIYIPKYLCELFINEVTFPQVMKFNKIHTFMGMRVVYGYENSVVVSFDDAVLKGVEPIKIKIP